MEAPAKKQIDGRSLLLLKNVRLPKNPACSGGRKYTVADILLLRDNESGKILLVDETHSQSPMILHERYGALPLHTRQMHGWYALPGFTDLCCHNGPAEFFYRENPFEIGLAAAAGGFAQMMVLPFTVLTSVTALSDLRRRFAGCTCHARFAAGLVATDPRGGLHLTDFSALKEAGAAAFTDAGGVRLPDELLYAAMKKAAKEDHLLILPLRSDPTGVGQIHEGRVSNLLKLPGIDPIFEKTALARILLMAGRLGCRVHIPVVAGKDCIRMLREAKAAGVPVSCGTSPCYFSLTEEELIYRGAAAKLLPPLREESDRMALIEGLADGTIDCICSAHTPCSPYEKQSPLLSALPGALGLETALPAAITYLVATGYLSLHRLSELLAFSPASILGEKVSIAPGESADLTLIDPGAATVITENSFKGKAHNSPFLGRTLQGAVKQTILHGKPVWTQAEEGEHK